MTAQALEASRFVRRTQLGPGEYRKNFRQVDGDVITAVTSPEADRITPLMSKIYLRLVNAPAQCWERDGVLRFEGELSGDRRVTAWDQLCEAVGVASATASKALRWMHEQGIIGYFAGKNGVGIRVFINRASSSIGTRAADKKILEFPRASSHEARTSASEAAFSDSFAVSEVSEKDLNPRAPKNGAEQTKVVRRYPEPNPVASENLPQRLIFENAPPLQAALRDGVTIEEVASRLRHELEPSLWSAARRAAAEEHERTREWLEKRGLPKAARVAQHEAYNVLRKYGVISDSSRSSQSRSEVGGSSYASPEPHQLSADEVDELAQSCVAMLKVQGQSIEMTLSKMSSEAGGFLLPEDAGRVREKANFLVSTDDGEVMK